jgi:hypothetical protein
VPSYYLDDIDEEAQTKRPKMNDNYNDNRDHYYNNRDNFRGDGGYNERKNYRNDRL